MPTLDRRSEGVVRTSPEREMGAQDGNADQEEACTEPLENVEESKDSKSDYFI